MNKKQIEAQRHALIVKSNDLIRKSRFDLSMVEQKIVLYMISQLDRTEGERVKELELSLKDFCNICGIDAKDNLTALKKIIGDLRQKQAWITLEDGTETIISWIEKPWIKKNSSTIRIRLDEDLFPYLLNMRKNFTQYELIAVLALKSKYSIRLYEILKSYAYKKECFLPIDELRESLCMGTMYSKTHDFRRYALDVAVEEINAYTDLQVSYTVEKDGTKILGFCFEIETIETEFNTATMFLEGAIPSRHAEEASYKAFLKQKKEADKG